MSETDFREEIMAIYDLPEWLRERWRRLMPPFAAPAYGCYRLPSGSMVHVKPSCRCPR